MFVTDQPPDPNDPEAKRRWSMRKRGIEKMVLEEYNKEDYEDLILEPEAIASRLPQPPAPPMPQEAPQGAPTEMQAPQGAPEGEMMAMPEATPATPPPALLRKLAQKIPMLNRFIK